MKHQLDVRKLLCPIPVIRTQNKVKQLEENDELEILATDPGVLHDIPAWARINGHQVLETEERDRLIVVWLRIGEKDDVLF